MLYKKNNTEKLSNELFENPTSEYRGAPFWAWNCDLTQEMLIKQIGYLKEMGFGGFHMHCRAGLSTEYLGTEFMNLIKCCRDKAEAENMYAYLYDEDRWPSGSAGGIVTKNKKFRQKFLVMTEKKDNNAVSPKEGYENGLSYLIACFDVILNPNGTLKEYKMIDEDSGADGIKKYFYVRTPAESGWFNGQTYVDTLSDEAMNEFIKVTYEAYKRAVGESFGKSIPSIFTDAPQFAQKQTLKFAENPDDVRLPWTTDFPLTYKNAYGEDIVSKLPELFWDLDNTVSSARYHFHDHICERFTNAFADKCGKWCDEHGLYLTGHMVEEDNLTSQTRSIGEAMRAYRAFRIPGIDMLCDDLQFTTAKQAQSAAHQYGREGVMSELYGVTNWDFDFRGHKFQGDWQAALGVTLRVPHLSWVSMKGSAKRDYPASINYQSPWYKEYGYIEDHFARLNTALTRGKPEVKIGVIHPIESFWLHWGPSNTGSDIRREMEDNFANITKFLINGFADFDFISESLLPTQVKEISDLFPVGEMTYFAIIVPGCETLRRTTFETLKKFRKRGGKLVFIGKCPKYIDAKPSDEIKFLYDNSIKCDFIENDILKILESEKFFDVVDDSGIKVKNMISQLRDDNDVKWLFFAHSEKNAKPDVSTLQNLIITIKGEFTPEIYDTVSGKIYSPEFEIKDGKTVIRKTVYAYDNLLFRLSHEKYKPKSKKALEKTAQLYFTDPLEFKLSEDNVYILDMAEYNLDGGEWNKIEETLRIDMALRKILRYPSASGEDSQPWVLGSDKPEHYAELRFTIKSEVELNNVFAAFEEAENICLNNENVPLKPVGYYTDESIIKYALPKINIGENTLTVKVPIGKRTGIENGFLLGNFGVKVNGCEKTLTALPEKIGFSSITYLGMPFYGGNVIYKTEITTSDCSLTVKANKYRGALIKVLVDGRDAGIIAYAPYELVIENVSAGTHKIEFVLFGTRINTFGQFHNSGYTRWFGPSAWYTENEEWSYEYRLKDVGILSSPIITICKSK